MPEIARTVQPFVLGRFLQADRHEGCICNSELSGVDSLLPQMLASHTSETDAIELYGA
jgi:hypothetical protein